jgi:PST family polysaccharide transporter
MNLAKTSLLSAISTIIRIITGFIINKVVAVYVGPSGLAIIGQLQNFTAIASNLAGGFFAQGVVKYSAEYGDDRVARKKLFSSAFSATLWLSLTLALVMIIFSNKLSVTILNNKEYGYLFKLFGATVTLFSLNVLLLSALNGLKEIKKLISVNIVSSLISLVITSTLTYKFGLKGALIALVTNQSAIFFITLAVVIKSSKIELTDFFAGVDRASLLKLMKFSLMGLTAALLGPASHIYIKNYLGESLGWDSAGLWQGIWYISTTYLMVVTTALSIYYLPRLSEIKDKQELKKEIFSGYKLIMPIVTLLALGIYIFRILAIKLLFTDSFMAMEPLFIWQLVGDVLKIGSWLLSFVMLAKAMIKIYIVTELISTASFVLLSVFGVEKFGIIGMSYAHALNYLFYLIMMIAMFIWYLKNDRT